MVTTHIGGCSRAWTTATAKTHSEEGPAGYTRRDLPGTSHDQQRQQPQAPGAPPSTIRYNYIYMGIRTQQRPRRGAAPKQCRSSKQLRQQSWHARVFPRPLGQSRPWRVAAMKPCRSSTQLRQQSAGAPESFHPPHLPVQPVYVVELPPPSAPATGLHSRQNTLARQHLDTHEPRPTGGPWAQGLPVILIPSGVTAHGGRGPHVGPQLGVPVVDP